MSTSDRLFLWTCALLFVATSAITVVWCGSMSAMDEMPMPGGWTMSMAWMRMPGQSWLGATASFLGMWVVMMAAMMLPSLAPMLRRYRASAGGPRLGARTAIAGAGYLAAWTAFGVAAYPAGVALAAALMRNETLSRAVPLAAGAVVVAAGVLQLTTWKARCLASCRRSTRASPADARGAWRHGVSLGLHCGRCCANLMAILMVLGVMDLGAMTAVAIAITAERIGPMGARAARLTGAVAIAAGAFLIAKAVGV